MDNLQTSFLNSLFEKAKTQPAIYRVRTIAAIEHKRLPQRFVFGTNLNKSHPLQYRYGKTKFSIFVHAEINVIRQALRILSVKEIKKAKLYVVRAKHDFETSKWVLGNACPCEGCKMAIAAFGIKQVCFSTDYGFEKMSTEG